MAENDILDDDLVASIADGTCVLFLGAGFSNAVTQLGGENVKTASQLAERIVESLLSELDGRHPEPRQLIASTSNLLDDGSRVFQLRLAAQFYISECVHFAGATPRQARERLIDILIQETGQSFGRETLDSAGTLLSLPWSAIYTTNYDTLIESALSLAGTPFQVTSRPSDLVHRTGDRVEVVKIHGSIDEAHLDAELPLVITADDYAEFGWTRGLLLDELRVNLAQRDFLFLGYGLQDENLDTVVRQVSRAIEGTPRSLYVHTRGSAVEPWWNYLRHRGFKVRRSQDLIDLAARLVESQSEFRTSHDAGYLDFAITDRDESDSPYDPFALMDIRASVARQDWIASREFGSRVDLSTCGNDGIAAMYYYLRAKRPERATGEGGATVGDAPDVLRAWMNSNGDPSVPCSSRGQWHRMLECLSLAAPILDEDHIRRVARLLRVNASRYPDTLSRWLALQFVRECQLKGQGAALRTLGDHVDWDARAWRDDADSLVGQCYRPVVPRLAWSLQRADRAEGFLRPRDETAWSDLLLTWELSKVSRLPIRWPADSARVARLGDGVTCDSDTVRPFVSSLHTEMRANPLVRRASLRGELDSAQVAATSQSNWAPTNALLELVDSDLQSLDRGLDSVEPFFASFVLLEHISLLRDNTAASASDALVVAHRQLLEAGREALDVVEDVGGDVARRARAEHFATAMVRDLLYSTRILELRGLLPDENRNLFGVVSRTLAKLSMSQQWMLENVLNVAGHLSRLREKSPLVDGFSHTVLAHPRQDDVWDELSPLLRYYVTKMPHIDRGPEA